ncbi:MAG: SufE family protein [Bacteroidetes bacterium]|nr:SufE family protein [Bacteroidota bacterium]
MSIKDIQDQIIEEFALLDEEGMDKYEYLIDLSRTLPVIDEADKTDDHLIEGCQSKVWLHAGLRDGKVVFTADSNTALTKGIISLLVRVLSGRTPQEIIDADLVFIEKIGLNNFLSAQRANGLLAMLKQMKLYALVFDAQQKK